MNSLRRLWLAAVLMLPLAAPSASPEPFGRRQTRLSIHGGTGTAFDENYAVLGAGAGYFPLDGLELGLEGEAWMGSRPHIYKLSPQVRYVFAQGEGLKPYVGALYRRTWFEGMSDLSSVGGRAGIYTSVSEHLQSGVGVVYERYLNCDEKTYADCSVLSPEVNVSLSF